MNTFKKARDFVYRNARPLEFALWQYHFENGNVEKVLDILRSYQNDDGGFGGLECDCWNPESSPIHTWQATTIIAELGFPEQAKHIINNILRYLESGNSFSPEHNQWENVIPSNNNYPHAIWWEYSENREYKYNPTASLVGFIIRFANPQNEIYKKACVIAKEAVADFYASIPFKEQHVLRCFIELYQYCVDAGKTELFDMEKFKSALINELKLIVCNDTSKWGREYIARPSTFVNSHNSDFYPAMSDIIKAECEFIKNSQLENGSWQVTWNWFNEYKREYAISALWWQSIFAIKNMIFLREFSDTLH